MSIFLLEHLRDELIASGAVQNSPEFCRSWLGRSEGYIRALRYHQIDPSVETLAVCSNKLGHYADRMRDSTCDEHQTWVERFDRLKGLCDQAIAEQADVNGRDKSGHVAAQNKASGGAPHGRICLCR